MKKVKFVTAFYANHTHKPFWGQNARHDRYLYSLKTMCNMKEKIVVYTDEDELGFNQLQKFKEEHNLDNVEIKVYPLKNNPYQERVYKIRTENADYYDNHEVLNYTRSPQIYWLKFDFLLLEFEPDINLYWIDMGLSCEGMFPPYLNTYGNEPGYKNWYRDSGQNYQEYKHKFFSFPDAFNEDTVKRIVEFTEDKFVSISRFSVSDCDNYSFLKAIKEDVTYSDGLFPVGGFFGGNSNYIPELVAEAKRCIDLVLEDNYYLCSDEEILTYLKEKFKTYHKVWACHTFYHEGHTEIFTEGMIPFHRFFSGR